MDRELGAKAETRVKARAETLLSKSVELTTKFRKDIKIKIFIGDGDKWMGYKSWNWASPVSAEVWISLLSCSSLRLIFKCVQMRTELNIMTFEAAKGAGLLKDHARRSPSIPSSDHLSRSSESVARSREPLDIGDDNFDPAPAPGPDNPPHTISTPGSPELFLRFPQPPHNAWAREGASEFQAAMKIPANSQALRTLEGNCQTPKAFADGPKACKPAQSNKENSGYHRNLANSPAYTVASLPNTPPKPYIPPSSYFDKSSSPGLFDNPSCEEGVGFEQDKNTATKVVVKGEEDDTGKQP